MRIFHVEKLTGITSSGTFSINTSQHIYGLLREVIVKPTTESTIYTIRITNPSSLIMFQRSSQQGSMAQQVQLPIKNVNTVEIINSNVDEAFTIELSIDEL